MPKSGQGEGASALAFESLRMAHLCPNELVRSSQTLVTIEQAIGQNRHKLEMTTIYSPKIAEDVCVWR